MRSNMRSVLLVSGDSSAFLLAAVFRPELVCPACRGMAVSCAQFDTCKVQIG